MTVEVIFRNKLLKFAEAATRGFLCKKLFLEISQNSQLCQSLFFNKVAGLRPATLLKKRLAQMFLGKFCEISGLQL